MLTIFIPYAPVAELA